MKYGKPTKKRGEISVNKAFGIIYFLLFCGIIFGPLIMTENETDITLVTFSILMNGGFLLITSIIILHIVFAFRDKSKR